MSIKIWRKKLDSSVWASAEDDDIESAMVRLVFYTNRFFSGGDVNRPLSSLASQFRQQIQEFTSMSDEQLRAMDPELIPNLVKMIDEMVRFMEFSWENASRAFNEIRLHYE
jgi:hypothetical protein